MAGNPITKYCMFCDKKKASSDFNYAGYKYDLKKISPFPNKIKTLKIPGDPSANYICSNCISKKFPLHCLDHGSVRGRYVNGNPPACDGCRWKIMLWSLLTFFMCSILLFILFDHFIYLINDPMLAYSVISLVTAIIVLRVFKFLTFKGLAICLIAGLAFGFFVL